MKSFTDFFNIIFARFTFDSAGVTVKALLGKKYSPVIFNGK